MSAAAGSSICCWQKDDLREQKGQGRAVNVLQLPYLPLRQPERKPDTTPTGIIHWTADLYLNSGTAEACGSSQCREQRMASFPLEQGVGRMLSRLYLPLV